MTLTVAGAPTVTTVDGRGFAVRHVRPGSGEGASTVTVLGREYGFEWLPMSTLPSSPDLVEGSYTRRLGDAGEFTLRFPNVASSKGLWREKFSESGALEFVEIYRDGDLEFVGSIERVEVDRGSVTISGGDGWSLLKRAYERDREWWDAPATVIDTYTRVPVPHVREQWATAADWTVTAGSLTLLGGGRARLLGTGSGTLAKITHNASGFSGTGSDTWTASFDLHYAANTSGDPIFHGLLLTVSSATPTGGYVRLALGWKNSRIHTNGVSGLLQGPWAQGGWFNIVGGTRRVTLSRAGRYIWGWVDSTPLFVLPADGVGVPSAVSIESEGPNGFDAHLGRVEMVMHAPFLRRVSDRGSRVLPGDQPTGGLRGRYHNIGDIQGLSSALRRARTLAPGREHYGERLDAGINAVTSPIQPGAATSWYAIRWTGAVWLPLSGGQVDFRLTGLDDGARVWVGDTAWDVPLIDDWADGAPRTTSTGTTNLGSVSGWYPIRVEYFNGASTGGITLQFYRANGWTDPGGTTIANATWTTVPATSLSPLGCHEARIQGQSHFQIIQDAASQAGYELLLEPMSLESGEFPGRLVPRVRVGRDTDVVLEADDTDSVEPILSPAVTRDSSDQAVRFIGAGSGNADGRGSQTIAEVADLTADALFELQSWTDTGDATLPQLLEARLNAELALRATPWEEVRGTPRAFERLADTWPLTGTLSAMRWRPGDGLRISVPDIGVIDTEPRRLTQVTRAFAAEGRTATTVGFRQRPRSAAVALRRLAQSQALAVRSNQRRLFVLDSPVFSDLVAASGYTSYIRAGIQPQDVVVRAYARVAYFDGGGTLNLEINGVDRTAALGGGWTTIPLDIDITAYATQQSTTNVQLYARFQRVGGSTSVIDTQLIVEVLRP